MTPLAIALVSSRVFKVSALTAIGLSALTAGVVFSAGKAAASTTSCTPLPMALTPLTNLIGQTCTTTDPGFPKIYSNTAFALSATPGFPSATRITLNGTGSNYPFPQQRIDTDFNVPGTINYTGGLIGSFYTVVANDPLYPIDGIGLAASGIGNFVIGKVVYSDATGSNRIAQLSMIGSGSVPIVSFAPLTRIWILDVFLAPGTSGIDNVQNTLRNAPGPLPLLGAGAAFGFSRKLRGRIKASRAV